MPTARSEIRMVKNCKHPEVLSVQSALLHLGPDPVNAAAQLVVVLARSRSLAQLAVREFRGAFRVHPSDDRPPRLLRHSTPN